MEAPRKPVGLRWGDAYPAAGFGALNFWGYYLCEVAAEEAAGTGYDQLCLLIVSCVTASCAFACGLLGDGVGSRAAAPAGVASGILMAAASLSAATGSTGSEKGFLLIGGLVGFSLLQVLWGVALCRTGSPRSERSAVAGFAVAALLMLLSSAAPLEAGLAASAAGALFAAFPGRALAGRDKQGGRQAQRPSPESSARPCVWLAVGLAVYGLLVGLSEGFGLHSKSQLGLAAESAAVLCALSATWLYMTKKRPKQERVIRALLVCFASSVLLFSIPHEPARQCGVMLFNATFNVTAAAVWSLMLNASERLANRSLGFCLLCLAYNGSQLLGYLAYDSFLLVLPGGIPYAVFTVIVFAIMLLAAIAPGPAGMSRVPAMRPEVREFVSLDERCGALGAQAGLTERETETVRYVARGWTKSYIASVLGLSENTVKSYLRNAYSKLGVHSRRELLELLEGS